MGGNKFKEIDKQRLVEFINTVADKAKFDNMTVSEIITFYGLLSYVQKQLLPKIDDNIFEIGELVENEELPPLPEDKE